LLDGIGRNDRMSLARAITIVENDLPGSAELLRGLTPGHAHVLGFTGPPGAGKSTLINAFLRHVIAMDKQAAVVAVDPTSPFTLGSLLGDRLRMAEHFNSESVFIRSIASRGTLGGLSGRIIEITDVLRSAAFDYIIVETIGVGQTEVEIAGLADTTIVILVPESGDDIQAMKSGIMEIADIFVVNKSDRAGADAFANSLRTMAESRSGDEWEIPVINTVATEGNGIGELFEKISLHRHSAGFTEKHIHLLTEKVYQLIRNNRMKDLDREELKKRLAKAARHSGFNMYAFAESYPG
jgi:LAO/AO transport system kinase